ncbi:hypothetical protein CASFOL_039101 [Castilleja foliolosa]|uniref:OTU domain-containing protein n=1 Tax=Castilleja foliolosa TaxID=1961234 RepID=A0ABD3BHD1_9LAMI
MARKDRGKAKNTEEEREKKASNRKSVLPVPVSRPPQDDDISETTAALHLDEPDHDYSIFVRKVRDSWTEVKHDNIHVLPEAKKSGKPDHVYIYVSGDEGLKVFIERYNGYVKGYSLVGKANTKKCCCWFDDQAPKPPNKDIKLIGKDSDYGGIIWMANYTDGRLGRVQIGQRALHESYFGLKDFLVNKWDDNIKITRDMIEKAGRSMLTILLMVCEAARFEDVERFIAKNYKNGMIGIPGIDNRVRNWSNGAKSGRDSDIRLYQYNDWKLVPKVEKEKLITGKLVQKVDKEKLKTAVYDSTIPRPLEGYIEIDVGRDGNCQFRALSHQLSGDEGRFEEVRADVVLQLHADRVANREYFRSDEEYIAYVVGMSADGAWGDHYTLQAAANAYNMSIVNMAWSESERSWIRHRIVPRGHTVPPVRELYVSLRDDHYRSLIRPPI